MVLRCTLKDYLSKLTAIENEKPFFDRKLVPNLQNISDHSGMSYSTISRIANNKGSHLNYKTGAKIIKAVRDCGFDMQVQDLIGLKEDPKLN